MTRQQPPEARSLVPFAQATPFASRCPLHSWNAFGRPGHRRDLAIDQFDIPGKVEAAPTRLARIALPLSGRVRHG